MFRPDDVWVTSSGENRYRRSLYTYWRRTTPYPAFVSFDAPSREVCVVKRARTNTPLQSLTTLNDPAFVDMARGLAKRLLVETGPDPRQRIVYAFRLCISRMPSPEELRRLAEFFEREQEQLRRNPARAKQIALGGTSNHQKKLIPPNLLPGHCWLTCY